ncbi:efflux RND transporter permease subunit [Evtepia sp.]|uniref:efflux RND transporter permease subunit n=1 Tax=Evtepia sp. TaxID=2773933 RepID=UPI002A837953|nr:MMPL family transporter [Evtepia sp.]MDY4429533.1 MMPL family transporter [Evtepia sp.]
MLNKLARFVTRKPKLVVMIALILLIPSLIGCAATRVNYDVLNYIPQDLDSAKGEALLEDPFQMAATAMLIVEDMPTDYVAQLQDAIEEVEGVSQVLSVAGSVGSQLPPSMLPEDLRSLFYADSGSSTQMLIFFDSPAASLDTMHAIQTIRQVANEKCFVAGFSALINDVQEMLQDEMPLYITVAALLALAAMSVMMTSWVLPVAILLNIGLAILYNMGTNVIFGEISFVTQALAAILQLGVTMDYSVFLYNRYREELRFHEDPRNAMAAATRAAFTSLSGSSLTTIAGFAALCFMRLGLGRDVGLVMMKGVLLGILCVVLVLPAILLVLDGPIHKRTHRCLNPDLSAMNRFLVKHRRVFVVIALAAYLPAVYSQTHTEVYHDLIGNMLPDTASSVIATEKLEDDFSVVNQHFMLVHQDALTDGETASLVDELKEVPGIDSVLTFRSWVSRAVPDFFIPPDVMEMFQRDGWTYIMLDSAYETGTEEMTGQINTLESIMKRYDPDSYLTGSAVMAEDLFDTADQDQLLTNTLSILAILAIVAVLFRSASMPVILVACIELAIYINEGVPYWMGTQIPFIANTFIGCIQLGATVDYSILLGTRYQEELRRGGDRKEAMVRAATSSDNSIITGGLVLFSACLSVALISHIDLVAALCVMLARGTLISVAVCLFLVPPILVVCEPLIARTSKNWKTAPQPKAETPVLTASTEKE